MVNLKINNIPVTAEEGMTIAEAAKKAGIEIPTLCHIKKHNEIGACRICVVEVKGARNLVASCVYPVSEGMEVVTNSARVINSRRTTLELMLSDHRQDCLSCEKSTYCELQSLANKYGCDGKRFIGSKNKSIEEVTDCLVRDNSKCILCRRCIAVCNKVQSIGVLGANERGFATHVSCAFDMSPKKVPCIGCGQCVTVCPTGALREKTEIDRVTLALADPQKVVVIGTAPSVRAAIAEEFGMEVGTNGEGKMITALRMMGFDKVFDVNCSADFTIMEEATELVERVKSGATLPMFTSCCPGWVKYLEMNHPNLIPNLSTCKSPQQMFGALCKSYYADTAKIDRKNMFVVAVMPCTAKKNEKLREGFDGADVDAVLTTRELARYIKQNGIDFNNLPESKADSPLGEYTGAGLIFGATGGVMEAALRTAVATLTGEDKGAVVFAEVRGQKGVKEAFYDVNGQKIGVAVVNGIANAEEICKQVEKGECPYTFIEVMTCPGGCVNGGGQPFRHEYLNCREEVAAKRAAVLYGGDDTAKVRTSHNNSELQEIYRDYLGKPCGEKAHKILHTHYSAKPKYTR